MVKGINYLGSLYTDIDKKKGPAVFLNLAGKARKSVSDLDVKDVSIDVGSNNIACIGKLYK